MEKSRQSRAATRRIPTAPPAYDDNTSVGSTSSSPQYQQHWARAGGKDEAATQTLRSQPTTSRSSNNNSHHGSTSSKRSSRTTTRGGGGIMGLLTYLLDFIQLVVALPVILLSRLLSWVFSPLFKLGGGGHRSGGGGGDQPVGARTRSHTSNYQASRSHSSSHSPPPRYQTSQWGSGVGRLWSGGGHLSGWMARRVGSTLYSLHQLLLFAFTCVATILRWAIVLVIYGWALFNSKQQSQRPTRQHSSRPSKKASAMASTDSGYSSSSNGAASNGNENHAGRRRVEAKPSENGGENYPPKANDGRSTRSNNSKSTSNPTSNPPPRSQTGGNFPPMPQQQRLYPYLGHPNDMGEKAEGGRREKESADNRSRIPRLLTWVVEMSAGPIVRAKWLFYGVGLTLAYQWFLRPLLGNKFGRWLLLLVPLALVLLYLGSHAWLATTMARRPIDGGKKGGGGSDGGGDGWDDSHPRDPRNQHPNTESEEESQDYMTQTAKKIAFAGDRFFGMLKGGGMGLLGSSSSSAKEAEAKSSRRDTPTTTTAPSTSPLGSVAPKNKEESASEKHQPKRSRSAASARDNNNKERMVLLVELRELQEAYAQLKAEKEQLVASVKEPQPKQETTRYCPLKPAVSTDDEKGNSEANGEEGMEEEHLAFDPRLHNNHTTTTPHYGINNAADILFGHHYPILSDSSLNCNPLITISASN